MEHSSPSNRPAFDGIEHSSASVFDVEVSHSKDREDHYTDDSCSSAVAAIDIDTSSDGFSTNASKVAGKKKKKKTTKKKSTHGEVNVMNTRLAKERSKLFNIQKLEHKGRSLFASKNIEKGTLLIREEPIAMIAYEKLCTNCLRKLEESGDLIQDESHQYCYYCSEECSQVFRERRNVEVPIIRNIDEIASASSADPYLLRMVLRILSWQYVETLKEDKDEIFVDTGESIVARLKGFHLMESHLHLQTDLWRSSILRASERILPLLPSSMCVSSEEFLRIAASVNTNAYGCKDVLEDNRMVGFGIFPFIGSTINHDCYPNCSYSYINGKLECRSIRDIMAGEEITVTYIDPMNTHSSRQSILTSTRYFECTCSRCNGYLKYCSLVDGPETLVESDDDLLIQFIQPDTSIDSGYPDALFSGLYCSVCGPRGVMICSTKAPLSAFTCRQCNSSVPNSTALLVLKDSKENLEVTLKEIDFLVNTNPSKCLTLVEKWLKTYEGKGDNNSGSSFVSSNDRKYNGAKLHPSHKLVSEAYIKYSTYLEKAEEMLRSVNTLRHAIDSVQLVLPENYPELIDLKETLLYRIEKLLKSKGNTIPPRTKQNLNKERLELSNKCTHGKLIAHGMHRVDRVRDNSSVSISGSSSSSSSSRT